jgi:hypothetical protein
VDLWSYRKERPSRSVSRDKREPQAGPASGLSNSASKSSSAGRDEDWQTFLRAIAEKASTDKHRRFGDLYRWLDQDVLRLCLFRLRKDAASGVDGMTYQTIAA